MKYSFLKVFLFLACSGSVWLLEIPPPDVIDQTTENSFTNSVESETRENLSEDNEDELLNKQMEPLNRILAKIEKIEMVCTDLENKNNEKFEEIKQLILKKSEETSQKCSLKSDTENLFRHLSSMKEELFNKQQKTDTKLAKMTSEIVKHTEKKVNKIMRKVNKPSSEESKNEPKNNLRPRNCYEILELGDTTSGIYTVQPKNMSFQVMCDMETRGGGWIVILNRFNGSQDFFLDWEDYKNDFGNLEGEFWLGLEHVYQLTNFEHNELLVELVDWDDTKEVAYYDHFELGDETEGYRIESLGKYSGTAGDSLTQHVNYAFATRDRDHNICAAGFSGAWWYHNCWNSNLAGQYYTEQEARNSHKCGMSWQTMTGYDRSLKKARMMIRAKI